ncbi:hypothetical protein [Salisediminibacterium halotolerans]|uniref:Uncharacterized protein n=1 Tax=Salisediminibacterium halotolerans TaxID=517425 RepID=A0A1H9RPB3_9BACI|nr:hypothetical protein [Salisediminibacterium haloalkalitolerans]SER73729.1 hypothetical protein SAMN05444126_10512 [Salisediminibacterium haloalkalitolerans]
MKDRLIGVNTLYSGMLLEYDILDDYGHILVHKGTLLTADLIQSLTKTGLTYVRYEDAQDEEEKYDWLQKNNFIAFLQQITFLSSDELALVSGINGSAANYLNRTEEWIGRMHNEWFSVHLNILTDDRKQYADSVINRLNGRFAEMYDEGMFYTYEFYYDGIQLLKSLGQAWADTFSSIYTPYPAGTVLTFEEEIDCLVIDVYQDEPDNPLIKPILQVNGSDPYFLKRSEKNLIAVQPLAVVMPDLPEE